MKSQGKLFFEIFLFLGFCACILFFLELRYKNYESSPDKLMRKFEQKKTRAEFLWLGNSHTLPLIAAADSFYNADHFISLSSGGIDLFNMHILFLKKVNDIPELKTLLLGIDEDLLGYNQTVFRVDYGSRAYFRYTDTLYQESRTERLLASLNFFRSGRDLRYLFTSENADSLETSALTDNVFIAGEPFCSQRAREHSEIRFSNRLIDENLMYLHKIIQWAKEKNLNIALFVPPKSACYLQGRNKQNIHSARFALDSLLRVENVPLFDLNLVKTYPDSLFADPDHLNRRGAKKYLEELQQEIFAGTGLSDRIFY